MAPLSAIVGVSAFFSLVQASPLAGRDAATPICSAWPYKVAQSFASYAPFQSFCSSRFPVAAVTVVSTVTPDPTTLVTTVFTTDIAIATSVSVETGYFTSVVATATELVQEPAVLRRAAGNNGSNAFLSTACSCIAIPATTYMTVTADASTAFETQTSIISSTSIVAVPSTTTVEVDVTTIITISSSSDTSTSDTSTSDSSTSSTTSGIETTTSTALDSTTASSTSSESITPEPTSASSDSTSSTSSESTPSPSSDPTNSSSSDAVSSTSSDAFPSTSSDLTPTSTDLTSSTTDASPTTTDSTTPSTTASDSTIDSSTVSPTSDSTTDSSSTSTTADSTTSTTESLTSSSESSTATSTSTTSTSSTTSSTPSPTPSNLISNGAFDFAVDGPGAVPYWSHTGDITVGHTQGFAHSKTQYADFDSAAKATIPQISQTVWSSASGASYSLTFYYSAYNISGLDASTGEYCNLLVVFGNQTLPEIKFSDNVPPAAVPAVYVQYGPVAVSASQDAAVLGLSWDCVTYGGGNADGELFVDDISLAGI